MTRIGVFCGSSSGGRPEYGGAAEALGHALVDRGLGLVYGGGDVGLMGRIAETVVRGGCEVIGAILRILRRDRAFIESLTSSWRRAALSFSYLPQRDRRIKVSG